MSSLSELKTQYEALVNLPLNASAAAKRKRGYDFERLLKGLFELDELDPRGGYKPDGEQIDGSIYLDGRVYLLEAKWHADPLPASTLYQFKGKVDGKLAGTLGIFISMSGYAEDAIDALTLGKGLNIILLDSKDLDAAILRGFGIKKVLKLKLRKAAEEGAIYFPLEGDLVTATQTQVVEIDALHYDRVTDSVVANRPAVAAHADLLIVCEGDSDRVIISTLAERILANTGSGRSIKILTAMGKVTIPRVANALWNTVHSESKVLIVTDGDNDPVGTLNMLSNGLEFGEWVSAIPDPTIETWLGLDNAMFRGAGSRYRLEQSREAALQLDIQALRTRDKQFVRFYDAILGP
jgi:hypothetical protein